MLGMTVSSNIILEAEAVQNKIEGSCYWVDNWGSCWSYQDVVDWWAQRGVDYENQIVTMGQRGWSEWMAGDAQEPIQQAVKESIPAAKEMPQAYFNISDGFEFVMGSIDSPVFWFIVLIIVVGLTTIGIAAFRIAGKTKLGRELFKMWFGK